MFFRTNKHKANPKVCDPLDTALFALSERDTFTVRHLLNSLAVLGRSGSGKTSSSGRTIARAIVRYRNSGGLILAAKPEDLGMWQEIFREAGREEDLIVFGPKESRRFNLLNYAVQTWGHTREITKVITTIGETLRSADRDGTENADFWSREQERQIYNAVEILKLATGKVHAPHLQKFIVGAAQSVEQLNCEEWRKGFHCEMIRRATEKQKSPVEEQDFSQAVDYWLAEIPSMASKTRSSISTGVLGLLHVLNSGTLAGTFVDDYECDAGRHV